MKRISWIELLVLPCTMAVLTTAWLTLWLRWAVRLGQAERPAPILSPWVILLVILTGVFVTRLALSREAAPPRSALRFPWDPGPRARRLVLNAGAVTMALALWLTFGWRFPFQFVGRLLDWGNFIAPEFIQLIAVLYLWLRGITIGRSRIPYDDLEKSFYSGIVALAIILGFNRFTPLLAVAETTTAILIFFTAGLGALALGSFERARRQQSETGLAFNRHWLATVAGVIGAILGGGLLLAGLATPESLARLRPLLSPVINFLAPGMEVLLTAIVLVLVWIAVPLFALVEWIARRLLEAIQFPLLPQPLPVNQQVEEALQALLQSPVFQATSHGLVVVLVVLFFGLLFVAALRRFLRLSDQEIDETRESILSRELLLNQLRSLLARRRPAPSAPPLPPYLTLSGPPDDPRLIVRRAYQSMLEWAASLGRPRAPGLTPQTYAATLSQAAPPGAEAIATLTQAYEVARYAAAPPSLEEAHRAENALGQLRTLTVGRTEE